MQTILIVITLVSLAMTIVLAAILVRLIRFEGRRSAARAALLREMADEATETGGLEPITGGLEPIVDESPDYRLREYDPGYDPQYDDVQPLAGSGDLFVRPQARSAWPRRAAVAATVAVAVIVTAFALGSAPRPRSAPASSTPAAASVQPSRLELLSLQQTQGASSLTITGLVQNPRDGAELSKVAATAMLFAADGSFLASGRAPLDFTVLRPGDESGFVITVPVTTPVARYRIGFRGEDGHVIGHVDRRAASTLATGTAATPRRGTS